MDLKGGLSSADVPLLSVRDHELLFPADVEEAESCRDGLGDIGRDSGAAGSHVEGEDEQKIQEHVQNSGEQQGEKRNLAVSDRAQQ